MHCSYIFLALTNQLLPTYWSYILLALTHRLLQTHWRYVIVALTHRLLLTHWSFVFLALTHRLLLMHWNYVFLAFTHQYNDLHCCPAVADHPRSPVQGAEALSASWGLRGEWQCQGQGLCVRQEVHVSVWPCLQEDSLPLAACRQWRVMGA